MHEAEIVKHFRKDSEYFKEIAPFNDVKDDI